MRIFRTPRGCAGADQLNAMEESINTQLEEMFIQVAKSNMLAHGVGRTTMAGDGADGILRLDSQKRECDGNIVFHAARALELALHVLYARGMDRVLGREYPGVSREQITEIDRKSHSLASVYKLIVDEFEGRNMQDALEHRYQHVLHSGVVDVFVDGKHAGAFSTAENVPFREVKMSRLVDGAELTLDHMEELTDLMNPETKVSKFVEMPEDTFGNFLKKADAAYYEGDISYKGRGTRRENMRWAHYSARDHEYGRPYTVIGTKFFARLVGEIIKLSHQRWSWDEGLNRRWHERQQYGAMETMKALVSRHFNEDIDFPEIMPLEEAIRTLGGVGEPTGHAPRRGYGDLHVTLHFRSTEAQREGPSGSN